MTNELDFTITPEAWEYLDSQIDEPFLELGLKVSGCSGFAYEFNPVASYDSGYHCFSSEKYSLKVIIKDEYFDKCFKGATLCLCKTTFGSQIKVQNPNISDSCGCGESFTLDK